MKALTLLTAVLMTSSAFAGTGVQYKNEAMGFQIDISAQEDNFSICNEDSVCLEFAPADGDQYVEVNGRCAITMTLIDENYAQGKTSDEFMLSLMGQVVQVVEGTCQLPQANFNNQLRSLTGIYL